jgi:hypothetical protein
VGRGHRRGVKNVTFDVDVGVQQAGRVPAIIRQSAKVALAWSHHQPHIQKRDTVSKQPLWHFGEIAIVIFTTLSPHRHL